jgi:type I restriction enzyme R subunit
MVLRLCSFFNTETTAKIYFKSPIKSVVEGSYKNRYDVTLWSMVAFGTNRTQTFGIEIKEAFNQINRYQNHSFGATRSVSIRAIVCNKRIKYLANNKLQSVKQTSFFWADANNKTRPS